MVFAGVTVVIALSALSVMKTSPFSPSWAWAQL
ncbi:hypothetical protein QQM39_39650 [Streptomyces sp. DT2A-34]|nr:hypothetical protein [Streptomyces sp. DT2A-34]MDO0916716.1 hypothetical protein [Streptomyces sp. DT2A-34]